MVSFPNAKINIGLDVVSKRADGFHNLETIFYPLPSVRDVLEILPSEKDEFYSLGLEIPGNLKDNLIWKALEILREDYPEAREPVKIVLYKNIPMGAGLGGGSADGAFALMELNHFFQLDIELETLLSYALRLGSDCPFFIKNSPCFATGRGEIMHPIALNLEEYTIQLICPKVHISTSQAFGGINPLQPDHSLSELIHLPITDWKKTIKNDFEDTVFQKFPMLSRLKSQMYDQGAIYSSLSGTGSTVYGIFNKNEKANIDLDVSFSSFII